MIEYPEELIQIAEFHGGELILYNSEFHIKINTEDRTSKENYNKLIDMREDIELMLNGIEYKIQELWADHNTQIIEFVIS